ncbi:MAG: NUDIX domain-containing protein [Verrucomicrobia subdivision 3 bacterium]|nr:NUDIX domain-containing protein [Limisphaerales bacterium]
MSEEIFDVCNEHDEVIGRAPRSEVHQRRLKHRAVHILVFNSRGEVFLQKRSRLKDCFPGAWDSSASGHLDAGEEYDACAVRELREELGVQATEPLRRLFKLAACPDTGHEHVWVYVCRCEGPFCLHPEEIERGDWFSVDRVNQWTREKPSDFANAFLCLWPRALAALAC